MSKKRKTTAGLASKKGLEEIKAQLPAPPKEEKVDPLPPAPGHEDLKEAKPVEVVVPEEIRATGAVRGVVSAIFNIVLEKCGRTKLTQGQRDDLGDPLDRAEVELMKMVPEKYRAYADKGGPFLELFAIGAGIWAANGVKQAAVEAQPAKEAEDQPVATEATSGAQA